MLNWKTVLQTGEPLVSGVGVLALVHGWSLLHLLQILTRVQRSISTRVHASRTALPYCTSLTVPFLKVTFMSGYT